MTSVARAIRNSVVRAMRKTTPGVCLVNIAYNQLAALRQTVGDFGSDGGTAHAHMPLERSLDYIDRVYADYRAFVPGGLYGKAAEIGPGDTCGVSLRLIEGGAECVDMVDRFYSYRDDAQQARIHRAVIERSPILRERMGTASHESEFPGITRHYGPQAAAETFFENHRGYDFIVSRAVLEHLQDVPRSIKSMAAALSPGGTMIHMVDLRDHGLFSNYGYHELKFLEIPKPVYKAMTYACGHPNRAPLSAYRDAIASTGLDYDIKIDLLVGERTSHPPLAWDEMPLARREAATRIVEEIRPRLADALRAERTEDLAVAVFTLIARAPGQRP